MIQTQNCTNHNTFGGKIYLNDFETDYPRKPNVNGSRIAARIAGDMSFDKRCKTNIINRENKKKYKNLKEIE